MKSQRLPTYRPGTRRASDIAVDVKLTEPARALLAEVADPQLFVARLGEQQLHADAIRFTAHRLPRALAVWWGCLCVWEVCRETPTAASEAVFEGILAWLAEPTDERRRQMERLADAAGYDTPAGMLALAVFLNDGSIAPTDLPRVAAKPHLTPNMVANAVLLASRTGGDEVALQRQFLQMAEEVLAGRSHWNK